MCGLGGTNGYKTVCFCFWFNGFPDQCVAGPGIRVEFNLTGTFAWTHEWYNQQGTKGFFGNYNVDNGNGGAGLGTANLNFWDASAIRHQLCDWPERWMVLFSD